MATEQNSTHTPWEVVKVGKYTGWSVHSKHDDKVEADFEAHRCNVFSDAQFHVRPARAKAEGRS